MWTISTERDWVVRFKAAGGRGRRLPEELRRLLAEGAGADIRKARHRIAWLLEPANGSDTFLTVPAKTVLGGADNPIARGGAGGFEGQGSNYRRTVSRRRPAPDAAGRTGTRGCQAQ